MGSGAAIVKAVAVERGWRHQSHNSLHVAITDLARETDDPDLLTLFLVAAALHTNFYENWYTKELVESGIRQVERFVEKMETLLAASP